MHLTELAPAAVNPVPVPEFSAHLRLANGFNDDGAEDALLALYLRTATAAIERRTGLALIRRDFRLEVARWDRGGRLVLPIGPVPAIDQLVLSGPTGSDTVAPERYRLTPGTQRQTLTGFVGCLPGIPEGRTAVLTFQAGFGASWNEVPDDLRQAVLVLAASAYETRSGDLALDEGWPHGVLALVERWQSVRL